MATIIAGKQSQTIYITYYLAGNLVTLSRIFLCLNISMIMKLGPAYRRILCVYCWLAECQD